MYYDGKILDGKRVSFRKIFEIFLSFTCKHIFILKKQFYIKKLKKKWQVSFRW